MADEFVSIAQKTIRVLGACLGLLLFCSPAFAQLNYGRILGGVIDQSGGAVAGCRTALVLSGKTERADAESAPIRPDLVLDSVADLRE